MKKYKLSHTVDQNDGWTDGKGRSTSFGNETSSSKGVNMKKRSWLQSVLGIALMTLLLSCCTSIRQVEATSMSRLDYYARSWTKLLKVADGDTETETQVNGQPLIDPSYWVLDCAEEERLDVKDENYLKETIQIHGHLGMLIEWNDT